MFLVDRHAAAGLSRESHQQVVTKPKKHIGRPGRVEPGQRQCGILSELVVDEFAHDIRINRDLVFVQPSFHERQLIAFEGLNAMSVSGDDADRRCG